MVRSSELTFTPPPPQMTTMPLILSLSSLCVVGRGGMAYDGIVGGAGWSQF
jgi:hypothetical protein